MPNPDDNNNPETTDAPQGASQAGEGEAPDVPRGASQAVLQPGDGLDPSVGDGTDHFASVPDEILKDDIYRYLSGVDIMRLATFRGRYNTQALALPDEDWKRFCEEEFKEVKPEDSTLTHREFYASRVRVLRDIQQAMRPAEDIWATLSKRRKGLHSPAGILTLICREGVLPALEQFSHENEDYFNKLTYKEGFEFIKLSIEYNRPHVMEWLLDRFSLKWGNPFVSETLRSAIGYHKADCVRRLIGLYGTSFKDPMVFLLDHSYSVFGVFLLRSYEKGIAEILIENATPEEVTELFDEYGRPHTLDGFCRQLAVINHDFGNLVSEGRTERVGQALRDLNRYVEWHLNGNFDVYQQLLYNTFRKFVMEGQNNFRFLGENGETITDAILLARGLRTFGEETFAEFIMAALRHIKAITGDLEVDEEEEKANNHLKILFQHLKLILSAKPLAHSSGEGEVADRICEILEACPKVLRLTVEGKTLFDYFFNEGEKWHYFPEAPRTLLNDNYSRRNKCTRDYLRVLACMVRLNGQSLEESAALKYAKQFDDQQAVAVLTDPVLLGNHRKEAEATPLNDQGAGSLMAHRNWMAAFHGDPTASDSEDKAGAELADMSLGG